MDGLASRGKSVCCGVQQRAVACGSFRSPGWPCSFAPGVIGTLALLPAVPKQLLKAGCWCLPSGTLQRCLWCYSNQACDLSTIPALLCTPSLSLVIRLNLLLHPGGLGHI